MKTALVCSQKGGTGKSMIANELAYSMDRSAVPYEYYDLDPQGGSEHTTARNPDAPVRIVDTPGYMTDGLQNQMAAADVIVITTRASMGDQEPLLRLIGLVQKHAPTSALIIVVNEWNRYTSNRMYTDWLSALSEKKEFRMMCVRHSEAVPRSGMDHVSALEYAVRHRQSKFAKDLNTVIGTIRRAIGVPEESLESIKTKEK